MEWPWARQMASMALVRPSRSGSVMSGVVLWAVIGPIVAIAGIVLIVRSRRGTPE